MLPNKQIQGPGGLIQSQTDTEQTTSPRPARPNGGIRPGAASPGCWRSYQTYLPVTRQSYAYLATYPLAYPPTSLLMHTSRISKIASATFDARHSTLDTRSRHRRFMLQVICEQRPARPLPVNAALACAPPAVALAHPLRCYASSKRPNYPTLPMQPLQAHHPNPPNHLPPPLETLSQRVDGKRPRSRPVAATSSTRSNSNPREH